MQFLIPLFCSLYEISLKSAADQSSVCPRMKACVLVINRHWMLYSPSSDGTSVHMYVVDISMFACKQASVMTGSAVQTRLKWAHCRLISIPICLLTSGRTWKLTWCISLLLYGPVRSALNPASQNQTTRMYGSSIQHINTWAFSLECGASTFLLTRNRDQSSGPNPLPRQSSPHWPALLPPEDHHHVSAATPGQSVCPEQGT